MSSKTLIAFDYAIKYLLKDKGDYEIVEGFISALLTSEGYNPVKIKALLENESNRESGGMKKSIADVIVEDTEGQKFLVEIERQFTDTFMHKACFNTSRLIIDSIEGGGDFSTIKKVFHISLLYFVGRKMKAPVYHGKTVVKEVGSGKPQDLHLIDIKGKKFDAHNVFPEYFFISIPLFDDTVKREIDEWLYVMKHSEVKKEFKSRYMKKVAQKLNILKMSDDERIAYQKYMKEAYTTRDAIDAATRKGIELGETKGEAKGKVEGKMDIARTMLQKKYDIKIIAKLTGLSIDEIKKLT